ncbi:MAG: hypothetical protein V1801_02990 [Candidatus Falkowbacteria bacterium]
MEKEATHNEILDAINNFFSNVDGKINSVQSEIKEMKSDIGWIKSNMVTKDFLDDKLADLRGDLVVLMRKEDTKLLKLLDILKERKLISPEEATAVLSMEPFPKLAL